MTPSTKVQSENPRAIRNKEAKVYLGQLITARFVIEVHRLELEGYVENRSKLEADLFLYNTAITNMRSWKVKVNVEEINILGNKYGGDVNYIMRGIRAIEPETLRKFNKGKYPGYVFPYRSEPHPDLVVIANSIDKEQGAVALGVNSRPKE